MQLFAANCTSQSFELNYRVSENNRSLKQLIPSGENRRVGDGNFTPRQIAGIIEQGAIYGMVDYNELERIPDDKIVSIVFRRDEPVPAGVIQSVIARNQKDLTEIGRRRREELAIAAARIMDPNNTGIADRVSLGIEEVEQGTVSKEAGNPLNEGFAAPQSGLVRTGQVKGSSKKGKR